MESINLQIGDFFHVEVCETAISEKEEGESDIASIKLVLLDGPFKRHYLYFDNKINPHLVKELL